MGRLPVHGNRSVPVTFVAFDVPRVDGHDAMCNPWSERRALLEELGVELSCVRLSDVYDDGQVLFDAVVEHGLEGIVAKRRTGIYRPGYRGWTKIKNPGLLAPRDGGRADAAQPGTNAIGLRAVAAYLSPERLRYSRRDAVALRCEEA